MLTSRQAGPKLNPVAPHGRPGLASCKPSAQALTQTRLFLRPQFYGGAYRGALGRAVPRYGKANPVRPATSISLDGGGSQSLPSTVK